MQNTAVCEKLLFCMNVPAEFSVYVKLKNDGALLCRRIHIELYSICFLREISLSITLLFYANLAGWVGSFLYIYICCTFFSKNIAVG